ncbi:hypothetical protein J3E64_001428 [Sphingobium sp. OAS761]|uniref:autotransporter outer membrane beta-barrel domain-containing protein n=1 Tax=Sphingobium sp. OAS761 TaxID=2817901 RepID=UPI0020A22B1B|nr:autotransporter outer membrane beta-barrel domain-containing protein [Sphingobium sp. OAS761]MCP1469746.1 hypothetical protein [Sphingobium sp. OAS761]
MIRLSRAALASATALAALTCSLPAAAQEAADTDPPPLVVGSVGPVIYGPDGRPYTMNIGNGTETLRATVVSSERGLNIVFTDLRDVDPDFFPRTQISAPGGIVFLGSATSRYGFETGDAGSTPGQENSTTDVFGGSAAYRLFETTRTITSNIGGGITANVRAGGVIRSSASAPDSVSAQAAALDQIGALSLPGRRLSAVVTRAGIVEDITEFRVSAITARDTYVVTIITFGPANIIVGKRGRCDEFLTTCEGGLTYAVGDDETNFSTFFLEDVYVTHTVNRTVTSTGTITIDIPFAAYGRVHPAAQAMGFQQSGRFLARLLPGGDMAAARPLGRADSRLSMYLAGIASRSNFDARGGVASSSGTFSGVTGGLAWRASDALTLGLAGEGGRWRWHLDDPVLPERADSAPSWRAGGFAAWSGGPWRIGAAGFGGRQTVRSVASSTLGGGTSTARYRASTYGAGVQAGYALPVGAFTLTPSLGADWLGWHSPAATESGGLAPLAVARASREQWRLHAGLAADHGGEHWLVGAHVTGTYVTGDRTGLVMASDGASAPGRFGIEGPSANRTEAEMGAVIGYRFAPGVTAALSGDARFGRQALTYGGQASLRFTF